MNIDTPTHEATQIRQKLEKLSHFLDSAITLPGGYRIGWDGIIGLIPGVGDTVGMGISLYILVKASRLGASRATLLRMLGNVGVETLVGIIPIIGDIFDLTFKANNRNMQILNRQLSDPAATRHRSRIWLFLWLAGALVVFLLFAWLMLSLAGKLLSLIF